MNARQKAKKYKNRINELEQRLSEQWYKSLPIMLPYEYDRRCYRVQSTNLFSMNDYLRYAHEIGQDYADAYKENIKRETERNVRLKLLEAVPVEWVGRFGEQICEATIWVKASVEP